MRRLLLILIVFLLPVCANATAYFTIRTGTWSNNTTGQTPWAITSCGTPVESLLTPGNGDTITICNGHTVTDSDARTIGTSGATATISTTINNGGTLVVSGAALSFRGDIDIDQGGTLTCGVNGVLNDNPPDGSTYKILITNSGAGNATINLTGSAGNECLVQVTKQGTTGGPISIDGNTFHSPILNFSYANIKNCGTASADCINPQAASATQSMTFAHTQFIGDGRLNLGTTSGAQSFTMDSTDFRGCIDTNGPECLKFGASAVLTTGVRTLTNVTGYNTTTKNIDLFAPGFKIGQSVAAGDASNIIGVALYGTLLGMNAANSKNGIVKSSIFLSDTAGLADHNPSFFGDNTEALSDSISYSHYSNPHFISEASTGSLTSNVYNRNVCDGDGFWSSDAGDMLVQTAPAIVKNNVAINSCGTLFTLQSGTGLITNNNTQYNSFGGAIGETTGAATNISVFRNNLTVHPSSQNGGGFDYDGIHQSTAFVRQSSFSMDYNYFWQMPGSADSGAPAAQVPALLTQPTLNQISYVDFPLMAVGSQTSKTLTAGTSTTAVVCTTCAFTQAAELGVQLGDYVIDLNSHLYSFVSAVGSATTLTVSPAIAGMASGDTIDVRKSYWNTVSAKYGDTDKGANDQHANPQFTAPTRTMATWITSLGGTATVLGLAAQVVKLNGFDSAGSAAAYTPAYNVWNALTYINQGFTPMNSALKNASKSSDCTTGNAATCDIGGVFVYPAPAQVIF